MLAGRLEGGPMADGHQHVMQSPPPRHVVVHLVGRHDDSSTSFGHRRTALDHPLVLRAQVMVQLAEDILLTQRHLHVARPLLVVGVHDCIGRPMLLAWPGWWISDATFAARAKTRFESSSPARASSSVTSASSCATRSFTPKARQPRGRHLFEVKSRAGRTLPAGSANFFHPTATRRILATKIWDLPPFDRPDKLV